MEKSHREIRTDRDINRFYPEISNNIETITNIPEEKSLLILNQLLAYACDASNVILICYAKELIKKISSEWLRNNIRKTVEIRTGDCWISDMNDSYVYGSLKDLISEINCTEQMPE